MPGPFTDRNSFEACSVPTIFALLFSLWPRKIQKCLNCESYPLHQESKEMFTSNAGLTIDPWVTENEPLLEEE